MIVDVKNKLQKKWETIQTNLEHGVQPLPLQGTLMVIDSPMDFRSPDGYIQFMKLAFDQIPALYGKQNTIWQVYLDNICRTAEKLQSKYTKFTGDSRKEFQAYCEALSNVRYKDVEPLEALHLDLMTEDNQVAFVEKHVAQGSTIGLYYEPGENVQKELRNDLVAQLSNMKFEKPTARMHEISYHLLASGYHEQVHDALNVLLGAAVYAINCSSTTELDKYSFDTQKIHNDLMYATYIMKRAKSLT